MMRSRSGVPSGGPPPSHGDLVRPRKPLDLSARMVDGVTHKIYSPAFRLTGISTGTRRLQSPAALPPAGLSSLQKVTPAPTKPTGHLPEDPTQVDDATAQSEECTREDLRFNFGQGVEVRFEAGCQRCQRCIHEEISSYILYTT